MAERNGTQASMRIGLLRLTDAAPVAFAAARGLFAEEGVEVALSVEPSWANVADKLAYGLLDGAVMLPPLALAMELGLRPAATPLVVPMSLSLNGNSVVLAEEPARVVLEGDARPPALEAGRRLRHLLERGRLRPCLAVVHAWSTHDLLLRYWLAASRIAPEEAVDITVMPPAEMPKALAAGHIDGFCAGAPWGAVAARMGAGRAVVLSSEIWRNHPEKCLAVRADWADRHPSALQAVMRALLRAGIACDDPAGAEALATLLAEPGWVGVPTDLVAASLPGGQGGEVDRSVFAAHAAAFPWRSHARWLATQMARWRSLPADAMERAVRAYRPELYAQAARELGLPVPRSDHKTEGAHDAAWCLAADPTPIAMQPDPFCDGARFEA
jgi:NitT/TauT family transport system ATP-binding protein/nitrate/nitrite transport system substrate-binding protein